MGGGSVDELLNSCKPGERHIETAEPRNPESKRCTKLTSLVIAPKVLRRPSWCFARNRSGSAPVTNRNEFMLSSRRTGAAEASISSDKHIASAPRLWGGSGRAGGLVPLRHAGDTRRVWQNHVESGSWTRTSLLRNAVSRCTERSQLGFESNRASSPVYVRESIAGSRAEVFIQNTRSHGRAFCTGPSMSYASSWSIGATERVLSGK